MEPGVLHIISAGANAGKTIWTMGLARALREEGVRVAVYKPVGEDHVGREIPGGMASTGAMHLMAASENAPHRPANPVVIIPTAPNRCNVLLYGEELGEVARLGRDMPILADLPEDRFCRLAEAVLDG